MNSHDGGAASQQQEVEEEEEEEDDVLPLPAEDGVAAKCQHNGWASSCIQLFFSAWVGVHGYILQESQKLPWSFIPNSYWI